MRSKPGVDLDNLHPLVESALPLIEAARLEALEKCQYEDMVITSGAEGRPGDGLHSLRSWHYPANCPGGKGLAVDVRTTDFIQRFADLVKQCLGDGWDVVAEGDHVHVERDPKKKPL